MTILNPKLTESLIFLRDKIITEADKNDNFGKVIVFFSVTIKHKNFSDQFLNIKSIILILFFFS